MSKHTPHLEEDLILQQARGLHDVSAVYCTQPVLAISEPQVEFEGDRHSLPRRLSTIKLRTATTP